jgi:predicted nucleic acid-binding protein
MKRFLLDTAVLAAFLHGRTKAIQLITPLVKKHEAATSMLVYAEITEYLKGFPTKRYRVFHKQLLTLLQEITPYPLTYPILDCYADIRRQLRPPHGKGLIGDIDTLIAATALDRNLTLLTLDTDFDRVPKLKWKLVNLKAA